MLEVLAFCDTARSAARPGVTSVPIQPLTLLNGDFVNWLTPPTKLTEGGPMRGRASWRAALYLGSMSWDQTPSTTDATLPTFAP
jgi:hypothetical protein